MGIYETLYKFADCYGQFMGAPGTHPWSQGFPLTTPLEQFGGPALPSSVEVTWEDRFYPKAPGHPALREAIAAYYNTHYGCSIAPENVFVCAGGRAGIFAILRFLKNRVKVPLSCHRPILTTPSVLPSVAMTPNHSLLTSHHSPLTTHHPPLTNHHYISHQGAYRVSGVARVHGHPRCD